MNVRPFNPRRIPNHFRLQSYIEEELNHAKVKLESEDHSTFTSQELIDFGLIYLEIGHWDKAKSFYDAALNLEQAKSDDLQDKEVIATVHYISATMKREKNDCLDAIAEYEKAKRLAQSDWLKSNLFRNLGLAYLKMTDFETAAKIFKEGLDFTDQVSRPALRGAIPAMKNYWALSLTRSALKNKQDPSEGLKALNETTKLYNEIFLEKNISKENQLKSHDFQSHLFHSGMVICEIAEQKKYGYAKEIQDKLIESEQLLLTALAGRIANKADEQRLGDVCAWLGRTYAQSNQTKNAQEYFKKALRCYCIAFANDPEAKQIKDVKMRLTNLNPSVEEPEVVRSALAKLSLLAQSSNSSNDETNAQETLRPNMS